MDPHTPVSAEDAAASAEEEYVPRDTMPCPPPTHGSGSHNIDLAAEHLDED